MPTGHFEALVGPYRLIWDCGRPDLYYTQRQRAALIDEIALDDAGEYIGVLSVGTADGLWPFLVLMHGGKVPWTQDTLRLDVVLVPETHILFVGAHTSVHAYDLRQPARLWTDTADTAFLGWERHGDTVVMSAELELAAWDIHGHKLWSTFVEPPYEYVVADGVMHLTVMGVLTTFPLMSGPSWGGTLPWRHTD